MSHDKNAVVAMQLLNVCDYFKSRRLSGATSLQEDTSTTMGEVTCCVSRLSNFSLVVAYCHCCYCAAVRMFMFTGCPDSR